ncbi:hypothetical protein MMUR_28800 [Mycolicibacterium murale]|uniref:Dihydroorotase n=1 Tax=Mycolicibacterium murale TaxID=182220 RepID=A0A7I9WM28_9MYCO|nr:hypothetical protein [Mycolicibacterium murale]MCV7180329.1 hypothetical protein [Mycolicibacterium murale]GFG58744.1 hypothetical protein MMUR_28800 [Mycolicibacterium murale]
MSKTHADTIIRDVLNPLTGERADYTVSRELRADPANAERSAWSREVDGAQWWALPAAVDGDAHMPFVPVGLRAYDLFAALHGGVHHMVVALPFQLVRDKALATVVTEMTSTVLPAITPVLSVSPSADSAGFVEWIKANIDTVRALLPSVCKVYTGDPNFRANLDAVWESGLTPAVFAFTPDDFDQLMGFAHGPLHIRHITSAPMLERVRAVPGATAQTSPHMLLELASDRTDSLTVLPSPPGAAERESLVEVFADIDVLASDHVSPPLGAPTGPGLQTQQHFLPAVLTCVQRYGWDLETVWSKLTSGPRAVFGLPERNATTIVDPTVQDLAVLWPRQRDDRAPYAGMELQTKVVAVITEHGSVMV